MKNSIDCNGIEKDMFVNMIEDWMADVGYGDGSEYDDMEIDLETTEVANETGCWYVCAKDSKSIPYTLTYNTDRNIVIIN